MTETALIITIFVAERNSRILFKLCMNDARREVEPEFTGDAPPECPPAKQASEDRFRRSSAADAARRVASRRLQALVYQPRGRYNTGEMRGARTQVGRSDSCEHDR